MILDPTPRLLNGTRARLDGKGDGWANAHRTFLGREYLMNDVDGAFGLEAWGGNTEERIFLEYEPDVYRTRFKLIRRFALVAMFDRKRDWNVAQAATVSTALYLWQVRTLSQQQPVPGKFFFVFGGQEPPWTLQELDIQHRPARRPVCRAAWGGLVGDLEADRSGRAPRPTPGAPRTDRRLRPVASPHGHSRPT